MSLIGVVEIPRGSSHKYEIDTATGALVLDRVLEMHYPANYGYIPHTLSEDGDALDFFVYSEAPIHPLVRVKLELLGVIEMIDTGVRDEKLVCRIEGSTHPFDNTFSQLCYFLRSYKPGVLIQGVGDAKRAEEILRLARSK